MDLRISCAINSKICYWDKHHFETNPVYCPIYYKTKQVVRKKKEYYINQNVSRDHISSDENTTFLTFEINKEKIFYDDIFCSISCCLAWIEDQQHNPKYKLSKQILFNELLIQRKELPIKANHWKILDVFGGFLSLEEFRNNTKFFVLFDFKYNDQNFIEEFYQEKLTSCN